MDIIFRDFLILYQFFFPPQVKQSVFISNKRHCAKNKVLPLRISCAVDYQIFFSPQVKQSVIISNKHGIYEFPHELPNNLRLRILGN